MAIRRMKRLCAAGVIALAAAMTVSSQAAVPAAELQLEYDRLFQQTLREPGNLDVMFRFAAVATRLGNYEAAISTLERMLLFNPDLPRVELELGVLYFRLDSYLLARSYFLDAIEDGDAPALVIQRVNFYLEEIDRRTSRHAWSGSITSGFRYQSNANAGPASNLIRVLGFDGILDDEFLGQRDGNFFLSGNATHAYDLRGETLESWLTEGSAFVSRQFTFDELDVAFAELSTGPNFRLVDDPDYLLDVRPFLTSNILLLGDELHFYTYGAGLAVAQTIGDDLSIRGSYTYRHKEFQDSSTRPTNDLQTSDDHVARLAAQYFVTEDVAATLFFTLVDENANTPFNSNIEYLVGGNVSVQYPAPFGLTDWPWRVDVSAIGVITNYDAPDPAVDPAVTREDREWRISVTNTVGFSREWAAFMQVGYSDNRSNLANFTFDNFSALVGLTRSFY